MNWNTHSRSLNLADDRGTLFLSFDRKSDRCSYVCQGAGWDLSGLQFRGCEVMCRTGWCWVGDTTGMGRSRWSASSYEVTPSRLKVRPGTADESFEGQQVRG